MVILHEIPVSGHPVSPARPGTDTDTESVARQSVPTPTPLHRGAGSDAASAHSRGMFSDRFGAQRLLVDGWMLFGFFFLLWGAACRLEQSCFSRWIV
jgi:hypothetical protein